MKNTYGLGIAIALGISAALLNFFYLSMRSQDFKVVDFVGLARDVGPGERLTQENLAQDPVQIPANWVGNLGDYAVLEKDRSTVLDQRVWRMRTAGSLLLRDDLKTPSQRLELGEGEQQLGEDQRAWPIPVDTRSFVPSLIVPGARVWFLAPAMPIDYPTRAEPDSFSDDESAGAELPESSESSPPSGSSPSSNNPASSDDMIGPFTVLALGNRLGSAEVMRAAKIRQVQENVLIIKVTIQADGSMEPRAQALRKLLERTQNRPLGYLWRPALAEDLNH